MCFEIRNVRSSTPLCGITIASAIAIPAIRKFVPKGSKPDSPRAADTSEWVNLTLSTSRAAFQASAPAAPPPHHRRQCLESGRGRQIHCHRPARRRAGNSHLKWCRRAIPGYPHAWTLDAPRSHLYQPSSPIKTRDR
jgi:hypothetical protein